MRGDFPERDWKMFCQLRTIALERFCEKVLSRVAKISRSNESAHQRYLRVFKLLREEDRDLAALFDDPKRSTAWSQVSMIYRHGLFTPEEMQRFSPETHERISELAKLRI